MQVAEEVSSVHHERTSISWISKEMMRERAAGPFDNYGEMLYAEGLEAAALRKSKVGGHEEGGGRSMSMGGGLRCAWGGEASALRKSKVAGHKEGGESSMGGEAAA